MTQPGSHDLSRSTAGDPLATTPDAPAPAAPAPDVTPPAVPHATTLSGASTALAPIATAPPPWFRTVVWDSFVGSLFPLVPVPFVDDFALGRIRQRLVTRVLASWGARLTPAQINLLAGGSAPWTMGRVASKVALYPLKKLFRKVVYFLAMKDSVDTLSKLFHQGYLLHVAAARGAFANPGGGAPDDARIRAVADAVHATLSATDTKPLGNLVLGVFRNSRRLFAGTFRWLATRLGRRDSSILEIEAEGVDPQRLHDGSPAAEQLLDRLVSLLWGQGDYRRRLERDLAARLAGGAPTAP
jgi:hypothetical protein